MRARQGQYHSREDIENLILVATKSRLLRRYLQELPKEWKNFDAIIGDPIPLKKVKFIKLIKYGKLALCRNPKEIFRSDHSIRFQFDMFHGVGNLDKAINLLPEKINEVRIVDLVGLDLQADGGTHVANTREVGYIRVVGHESKGRINKRIRIILESGDVV